MPKPKRPIPLVYSCSGCSSAAQLANHIAVRLDRSGIAEMSCIAGVGGDVPSLVRVAQSGRRIVAIDGCSLECSRSCLLRHAIAPTTHFKLNELGVKKLLHADHDPKEAEAVFQHIAESLRGLPEDPFPFLLTERDFELKIEPENEGPVAPMTTLPVLTAGRVTVRVFRRGDSGRLGIEATIAAESIRVVSEQIPPEGRARVESVVLVSILEAAKHPFIRFFAAPAEICLGAKEFTLRGMLWLRDTERPVTLAGRRLADGGWELSASIRQSDFGIIPVTALLGALRSRDEVGIRIRVPETSCRLLPCVAGDK